MAQSFACQVRVHLFGQKNETFLSIDPLSRRPGAPEVHAVENPRESINFINFPSGHFLKAEKSALTPLAP